MAKLALQELESHLWKSADILRGSVDSSDYKNYIFGLLFLKRLSDVSEERKTNLIKEHGEEIAIEVQQFMETRVSPIRDWTSKTDFKRELNADMKIMFLKKKMSMSDASMLVGYFMALAEVQYK
ncbi:type I restriction-modification system subunit M N-terminal domain-containing protein [Sutcliffiella horikoshii]|uniref:site-specific DNA-methyltransferase (adenine-specific) n=1 Tax=Sutcliffiella horikoshii TaxID=79883 RepID=A0A5D4TB17_9BACI|nr:type I restriction-modification system subunit M N-terminal domain-containing protein [Sutcliffiella horikoshii]TYS72405.1 SAM-dependent DNA methyltransferase [Sutcliffiella horikoshii]